MVATGEQLQALGADGARRAKRWLEATCRAQIFWDNPSACVEKLQYVKATATSGPLVQGETFSFDFGGVLIGGDSHGHEFLAESKLYSAASDQGVEYRRFLAKCYQAEALDAPHPRDHYLWITWAPFLLGRWAVLTSSGFLREAIDHDSTCRAIALAGAEIDEARVKQVAAKIVIIVLSERQEALLSLHGHEATRVRQRLMEQPDRVGDRR